MDMLDTIAGIGGDLSPHATPLWLTREVIVLVSDMAERMDAHALAAVLRAEGSCGLRIDTAIDMTVREAPRIAEEVRARGGVTRDIEIEVANFGIALIVGAVRDPAAVRDPG